MPQVQEAKPYVETWKRIAAHVGRSERWCRYSRPRAKGSVGSNGRSTSG